MQNPKSTAAKEKCVLTGVNNRIILNEEQTRRFLECFTTEALELARRGVKIECSKHNLEGDS